MGQGQISDSRQVERRVERRPARGRRRAARSRHVVVSVSLWTCRSRRDLPPPTTPTGPRATTLKWMCELPGCRKAESNASPSPAGEGADVDRTRFASWLAVRPSREPRTAFADHDGRRVCAVCRVARPLCSKRMSNRDDAGFRFTFAFHMAFYSSSHRDITI